MRSTRLVTLLLLLQARGRLTAAQLAAALEVSERTVYRDLADLGASGVPVVAERGEGGGYHLLEGYRTNLTGLTAEEAEALLLGGAAGPLADLGFGSLLAATRLKLLAAVPPGLRPLATRAEGRFHLDPTAWAHQAPREQGHLRTAAGAVWRDRRLRIRYARPDDSEIRRLIDPLGLVHKTGTWYLVGASAGEPRVYRIDRLRAAVVVDSAAERPAGFDLAAFWAEWEAAYAAGLPTFAARVRLGPVGQRYRDALGPVSPRAATEEGTDPDGWVRQTLVFDHQRVACAALLALAPDVEVLDPPSLREEMAEIARLLVERNSRSEHGGDGSAG